MDMETGTGWETPGIPAAGRVPGVFKRSRRSPQRTGYMALQEPWTLAPRRMDGFTLSETWMCSRKARASNIVLQIDGTVKNVLHMIQMPAIHR